MLSPYIGVIALFIVGTGFLVLMLSISSIFGPKYKSRTKQLPFECGSVSVGNVSDQRFNVRFYLVAMLFILFDIEVIFLYPWALNVRELGWFGYTEVGLFMAVLGVGLIYVWKKGVLDWNN